jgi:hypothetical protein
MPDPNLLNPPNLTGMSRRERRAATGAGEEPQRVLPISKARRKELHGKTFGELTTQDKDDLLKVLLLNAHLIQPDPAGSSED